MASELPAPTSLPARGSVRLPARGLGRGPAALLPSSRPVALQHRRHPGGEVAATPAQTTQPHHLYGMLPTT